MCAPCFPPWSKLFSQNGRNTLYAIKHRMTFWKASIPTSKLNSASVHKCPADIRSHAEMQVNSTSSCWKPGTQRGGRVKGGVNGLWGLFFIYEAGLLWDKLLFLSAITQNSPPFLHFNVLTFFIWSPGIDVFWMMLRKNLDYLHLKKIIQMLNEEDILLHSTK